MEPWNDYDEAFEPFTLGYTWNDVRVSIYCGTVDEADREIWLMFKRCGNDVKYSIDNPRDVV